MARPASPLTQAIWKLLESNPDLSHANAQPLLRKQGFECVSKPEMSDDLKSWREQGKSAGLKEKGDYIGCSIEDEKHVYDKTAYEKLRVAAGLSAARAKAVLQEIMVRVAFDAEANNFNVVKYNWGKSQNDKKPSASRKPKAKASSGSAPRPKHGKGRKRQTTVAPTITGDFTPTSAVEYLNENGGVKSVKTRVSEIGTEVAELEAKVAALRAEQERHESALTTLADFQKTVKEAA